MRSILPKVAIIGRPNVGKSTLFNRLTGTRHALVADEPGVTRDRREGDASIADLHFILIDTAGLEQATPESLQGRMTAQTLAALSDADAMMLMVDGRAGIIPTDTHFANLVRASGKPVILVVNKAEGKRGNDAITEGYALGFEEMVAISAEHGEGMGPLYDALVRVLEPEGMSEEAEEEPQERVSPMSIAIVGRPNVGKSTFINRLLGEDRVLTGPEAGITRDAIAIPFTYQGRELKLIDTAGMRKRARVAENKLETMAVNDTRRAIQYAQICVLMLDATQAMEKQDIQIASLIAEEGRACVLVLNKWDLVPRDEREELMAEVHHQIDRIMPYFRGMPVVTAWAEKGKGIDGVLKACFEIFEVWDKHIPTAQLNRWLEGALEAHTPPLIAGRRLKVKYMTQAKTRPPTFTLFVNHIAGIPDHYQRYLINGLRETFNLPGVPIRLLIRRGKNPYSEAENKE